jgi:hypothetical protein
MTQFGKRGLPQDAPSTQRRMAINANPGASNDIESLVPSRSMTYDVMTLVRRWARWGAVVYLVLILSFGLIMTVNPFGAMRFWAEYPFFQNLTSFALVAMVPFVLLIAIGGGVSSNYFERKRYEAQRATGKNPWPLYIGCGLVGLLGFVIFSTDSPLGLFASEMPEAAKSPIIMTAAAYVGAGFFVARILDYMGVGLSDD